MCFFRRPAGPAGSVQGPHRGGGSDPGHVRPQQRPLPVMAAVRGGAEVFWLLQWQHLAVCPRAHTHQIPAGTQHAPSSRTQFYELVSNLGSSSYYDTTML